MHSIITGARCAHLPRFIKVTTVLLVGSIALLSGVAHAEIPMYTLTNLGDLEGGDFGSSPRAVSNAGQVVGVSWVEPGVNGGERHAFIWDPEDGMRDLGTLIGPEYESYAWDINSRGQVVGWSTCPPETVLGNPCGFVWDPKTSTMSWLGDAPGVGPIRSGYAINESGDIAGWAGGGPGIRPIMVDLRGNVTSLESNTWAQAWGMNERGEVVGEEGSQAVLWDSITGEKINLGDLVYGDQSRAKDINERGQVVIRVIREGKTENYLWSERDC